MKWDCSGYMQSEKGFENRFQGLVKDTRSKITFLT